MDAQNIIEVNKTILKDKEKNVTASCLLT